MYKNKKVLAIIPARGGSKRIPHKNITLVAGTPLIVYTIEAALESKLIDRIIVSTDDKRIAEVSKKYGSEVITRPKKLARDDTPILPVLQHVVRQLEDKNYNVYVVVVLQPTSPLRIAEDIDLCIRKLLDTDSDSVETFSVVKQHPALMFRLKGGRAIPIDPKNLNKQSQDLPKLYYENGAVYVVKRDVLMKKNTIYGRDHRIVLMPEARSIDIDSALDLKLAELLINENSEKKRNR